LSAWWWSSWPSCLSSESIDVSAIGQRVTPAQTSHFQWPVVLGGAVAAGGASFTLNAFGAGIGLSLISTAPTWRDSSAVYWLIAGAFLLFVAIASFALGGYVAGRMRAPLGLDPAETEFRDGMHGLATWGVAVLMSALLALGVVTTTSATSPTGGNASQSVAGESIIASELDELFRTGRVIDDLTYRRAEAARILLKSSSHNGVPNTDRSYLTAITGIILGVPEAEARQRVDHAIAASAQALHRARVAAVLQAFFVATALLVGAVVAWYAACEGGKDRENGVFHFWEWSARRRI
jgi:hypothetical protein